MPHVAWDARVAARRSALHRRRDRVGPAWHRGLLWRWGRRVGGSLGSFRHRNVGKPTIVRIVQAVGAPDCVTALHVVEVGPAVEHG